MSERRSTKRRITLSCVVISLAAVVAHMIYDRIRGHVMATSTAAINGETYRVEIRERCSDSLDEFVLLHYVIRSRNPDFEYWAELHQGLRCRSFSNRFRGDSFSADLVRIESADERGAKIIFNRDSNVDFVWQEFPQLGHEKP